MRAKAVVAVKPYQIEYKEVEVPEPTADDVVIRLTQSWISNGTEGSFVRGERIAGDTPKTETDPSPFPLVPGYQKVGVVEWVGSDVRDVAVGEVVFATVSKIHGMHFPTGGHISPAVTDKSQVWKIPSGVSSTSVSGLVLTQVGYNCGMRPTIAPGDAAVVIGDGMVGHWSAQTLLHRGARVMMLGKHPERLDLLTTPDGSETVNVSQNDPVDAVRQWAPEGIQAIIDTVGSVPSIEQLYFVLKRFGHVVSAGFHGQAGHIDIQPMRAKEMFLHAPAGWTKERMDGTMDCLAQGVLTTEHLITHHFDVAKASEAFDMILRKRGSFLGVVLNW